MGASPGSGLQRAILRLLAVVALVLSTAATGAPGSSLESAATKPDFGFRLEIVPSPRSVPEGGSVEYALDLFNGRQERATIEDLFDEMYGDVTKVGDRILKTNCAAGVRIRPEARYTCEYTARVAQPGTASNLLVASMATRSLGGELEVEAVADVTVEPAPPSIAVRKLVDANGDGVFARSERMAAPGGRVRYRVVVRNRSVESDPVVVTGLVDDRFGDLGNRGTCRADGSVVVAPDGSWSCEFSATIRGRARDFHVNTVTATVADDEGAIVDDSDSARVVFVGDEPPVLSRIGYQVVAENDVKTVPVSGSDPDGDAVSFSVSGPAFVGLTDHGNGTATLRLAPDFDDAGKWSVVLTASDGVNTASETFTIEVPNTNRSPVLGRVGDQVVAEDAVKRVSVSGSDPDGDAVSFSVSGPRFVGLTDHGNGTATLRLAPRPGDAGKWRVVVTASDGALSNSETLTIEVTRKPPGPEVPVLAPVGDRVVDEGAVVSVVVSGSDPDGDAVSFSVSGHPNFVRLTDRGDGTATLRLAPGFDDAGVYSGVRVTVSDGVNTDSETFTIEVTDTDRDPVLDLVGEVRVGEGGRNVTRFTASDPDGDPVELTVDPPLPPFARLDDEGTGTVMLTVTPGFDDAAIYGPFTVTISDGVNSQSDQLVIEVTETNRVPVLDSVDDVRVDEGGRHVTRFTALDPDGDPVAWSVDRELPPFAGLDDDGSGAATLTVAPGFDDAGVYGPFTVIASDGADPGYATFTITVVDVIPEEAEPPASALLRVFLVDRAAGEDRYEYELVVFNLGPAPLDGVAVELQLPDELRFQQVEDQSAPAGCSPEAADGSQPETRALTCSIPGGAELSWAVPVELADAAITPRPVIAKATVRVAGEAVRSENEPTSLAMLGAVTPDVLGGFRSAPAGVTGLGLLTLVFAAIAWLATRAIRPPLNAAREGKDGHG